VSAKSLPTVAVVAWTLPLSNTVATRCIGREVPSAPPHLSRSADSGMLEDSGQLPFKGRICGASYSIRKAV
jgi:hypothetical protein